MNRTQLLATLAQWNDVVDQFEAWVHTPDPTRDPAVTSLAQRMVTVSKRLRAAMVGIAEHDPATRDDGSIRAETIARVTHRGVWPWG